MLFSNTLARLTPLYKSACDDLNAGSNLVTRLFCGPSSAMLLVADALHKGCMYDATYKLPLAIEAPL